MKAWYKPYQLQFKNPVLTSRGAMDVKNGCYLFISDGINTGVGECSFIEGLSVDNLAYYEHALNDVCKSIETDNLDLLPDFKSYPSIAFGYETALLDLKNGGNKILFRSDFTKGKATIPMNGLVWMGDKDFMLQQTEQKLQEGYKCIKIKVGAIDFNEEVKLLEHIRNRFTEAQIEIRLDANGAFTYDDGYRKLEILSQFSIHSIEQPVKPKQWALLQELCQTPYIPIALDEELIGIHSSEDMDTLISGVCPQYIILKPSLIGGFTMCDTWIELAQQYNIGWWATSALESNIGLNAIAQWVYTKNNPMVQGLGTGSLYVDNIDSPLVVSNGNLCYDTNRKWASEE